MYRKTNEWARQARSSKYECSKLKHTDLELVLLLGWKVFEERPRSWSRVCARWETALDEAVTNEAGAIPLREVIRARRLLSALSAHAHALVFVGGRLDRLALLFLVLVVRQYFARTIKRTASSIVETLCCLSWSTEADVPKSECCLRVEANVDIQTERIRVAQRVAADIAVQVNPTFKSARRTLVVAEGDFPRRDQRLRS